MHLLPIILLLLSEPAPRNLLANSTFESVVDGVPSSWALYVAPAEGALGRVDTHSGGVCVLLHTPLPYLEEPMNNWSQNIQEPLAGAELRISARIKTEEATAAGVLVQCWDANGPRVVQTEGTMDAPLTGNYEWTAVEDTFHVPADADFLTVRCVLLGVGSAWFDDVTLELLQEGPPTSPHNARPADSKAKEPDSEAPEIRTDVDARLLRMRELQSLIDSFNSGNDAATNPYAPFFSNPLEPMLDTPGSSPQEPRQNSPRNPTP